jgi:glucose-6-phosphate 1-dehydrogenase
VYVSLPPHQFEGTLDALKTSQLQAAIALEKPVGHDEQSCSRIIDKVQSFEHYFVDHYLGKEVVNNILNLRFGHTMFEPSLNKKYVDSIEGSYCTTLSIITL